MLVDVVGLKLDKKEAKRYALNKIPLMSKVVQFNSSAKDIQLEYIELKILKYEITSKSKVNLLTRKSNDKYSLTMIVNTYDGYSESVDLLPKTEKKYISQSNIKSSRITNDDIINGVKEQIFSFLSKNKDKNEKSSPQTINIKNISISEVKSIYKPYWVANFKGKKILIDA